MEISIAQLNFADNSLRNEFTCSKINKKDKIVSCFEAIIHLKFNSSETEEAIQARNFIVPRGAIKKSRIFIVIIPIAFPTNFKTFKVFVSRFSFFFFQAAIRTVNYTRGKFMKF